MNQNTTSHNPKPDHEIWAEYLEAQAAYLRDTTPTPAGRFLADRLTEYAAEARVHGLAGPDDHARWLAETEQEALAWIDWADITEDRWEADDDRTGCLTGHDDADDADLN